MARRRRVFERKLNPEPIFGSELVSKLINHVMWDGKKSVAEAIVYEALEIIGKKLDKDPIEALQMAIDKLEPVVEIRSRRVGGSVYPVPVEVRPVRRRSLAMRWLVTASRNRGSAGMGIKLANELMDIINGQGAAMKKREDVHRMAEANKAFSHFRF